MKLTINDLRALTHGAVSVRDTADGYTAFYRFNERQMGYYQSTNENFYAQSLCTAAIRLEMTTDADAITFAYRAKKASSQRLFYFDLSVDGTMLAHIGEDNTEEKEGSVALPLPAGTHRVVLYLPASFSVSLRDVVVKNATFATPITKQLKMLSMGDSITHGYHAVYPSLSYVNLIADALDASVVNQGIGAEVFNPGVVDGDLGFTPDVVTVAYGTNNWYKSTRQDFVRDAGEFYARVRKAFPTAKIFGMLPIWRSDCDRIVTEVTFAEAREIVRAAATATKNITVIDCDPFVPHLPDFFSDKSVHPNDLGFQCYAAGLLKALQKHLI